MVMNPRIPTTFQWGVKAKEKKKRERLLCKSTQSKCSVLLLQRFTTLQIVSRLLSGLSPCDFYPLQIR